MSQSQPVPDGPQNPPGVNIVQPDQQQGQQQGQSQQQVNPPPQNYPPPQQVTQGQPQQAASQSPELTGVLSTLANNVAALPERVVDAFREGVNVGQNQGQQNQGQGQQQAAQQQQQATQQQADNTQQQQTAPGQQAQQPANLSTRERFQRWWTGTQS